MYKILRYIVMYLISVHLVVAACPQPLVIHNKPIMFTHKRIALTQAYQKEHYGIHSNSIRIVPRIIVLHWTESKNLQEAFQTMYPETTVYRPEIPGKLNVSSHFLVDRDGTIYRLMPEHWMARHVIGLNHIAIGIENVGGVHNKEDLTQAQVQANRCLIRYLKRKYPTIHTVIGHYQYRWYRHTALWLEQDPKYYEEKRDPGPKFLKAVYQGL